jgi:hypothetical protein
MSFNKICRVGLRLSINQIGNIALLPYLNRFGFVCGDVRITHRRKQVPQHLWVWMRKLDKLEAIRSGWIFLTDRGAWRSVWKRSQGYLL